MSFSLKTIKVEFEVEDHLGDKHKVTHYLHPWTTTRFMEYQRKIAEADKVVDSDPSEAAVMWTDAKLKLWADQVNKVDGYEPPDPDAKNLVPPAHRIEAVDRGFFYVEKRNLEELLKKKREAARAAAKDPETEKKPATDPPTELGGTSTPPSGKSEKASAPEKPDAR